MHDVRPITAERNEKVWRDRPDRRHRRRRQTFGPHLECEQRGKAAARPSHRRDPFRIGYALIDRPFDRVEQIFLRSTPPFVSPGV